MLGVAFIVTVGRKVRRIRKDHCIDDHGGLCFLLRVILLASTAMAFADTHLDYLKENVESRCV